MSENQEQAIAKNQEFSTTRMPEIPEEAIQEIMLLLPVKSLLKFRCVSPSWLSFIDTPYFLKTHLSKSTPKIILHTLDSCIALDINTVTPKPRAQVSALKLCYKHPKTCIFGSCNGVLLSASKERNSDVLMSSINRKELVLQNPCTRTFHKVPFVEKTWPAWAKECDLCTRDFFLGLGYDSLTDDYKVFRNCQFYGWSYPNESQLYSHVTVYSMKRKSYKQIEPFPYYIHYDMDTSVFAGGALHWLVSTGPRDVNMLIASFDVATEEYRLVDQPVYSSKKFELHLNVLGGCLTVMCKCLPLELIEVWVMKEYGKVESWSKILSLMAADIGFESICYLKPMLYSDCGKRLLMVINCKTLLWYDLEKKSSEIVQLDFHNVSKTFLPLLHLESLVKLHDPGPWEEKRRAEDDDEKPKKRDHFLSKGFKLKL